MRIPPDLFAQRQSLHRRRKPGSREGKGPTSRGGGKGKPVNLCGPVSEALSGADIVSGPVIVVTTTPDVAPGQEPVPREPK